MIRGWALRADYYLTKPFDLDELGNVLEALLKEPHVAA